MGLFDKLRNLFRKNTPPKLTDGENKYNDVPNNMKRYEVNLNQKKKV